MYQQELFSDGAVGVAEVTPPAKSVRDPVTGLYPNGKKRSEEFCKGVSERCRGRTVSEEQKAQLSAANTGKKQSAETIAKRVAKLTGQKRSPEFCKAVGDRCRGKPISEQQKADISNTLTGRKLSPEHCAKISAGNMGKKMSDEFCEKASKRLKGVRPSIEAMEASLFKRTGKMFTPEQRATLESGGRYAADPDQRTSYPEYKRWRKAVFMRDNYTCKGGCGKPRGGMLMAHHIKSWAKHEDLRLDVSNGVTLCPDCHAAVDPHFAKIWNSKKKNRNHLTEEERLRV